MLITTNGRIYFVPSFSSPLFTRPNKRDARTSIVIKKITEKYCTNVNEMLIDVNVIGTFILASNVGSPLNIDVSTSTNIEERANNAGAPTATAKNMKIIYIKTLEAALFST